MSIKNQALQEYSKKTSKNQWYISRCLFVFDELKGCAEPENNDMVQPWGSWFKCLKEDISQIAGTYLSPKPNPNNNPKNIFRKATIKDIKAHVFKDEKEEKK